MRVIRVAAALAALILAGGCLAQETTAPATGDDLRASGVKVAEQTTETVGTTVTLDSGVQVIDRSVGSGPVVKDGDLVLVHYEARLPSGVKFDATREQLMPTPLRVPLGEGKTVPGFEMGLRGMRIGGARTIIIPPELGYGAAGRAPTVPPNSELHFDVEIVDLGKNRPEPEEAAF
jgi:FKBP-type peptidyl-prolyl cis-trans isomerase